MSGKKSDNCQNGSYWSIQDDDPVNEQSLTLDLTKMSIHNSPYPSHNPIPVKDHQQCTFQLPKSHLTTNGHP